MEGEGSRSTHLFNLSAASKPALLEMAQKMLTFLASHPSISVPNMCHTLNVGRVPMIHRLALTVSSTEELSSNLSKLLQDEPNTIIVNELEQSMAPPVAFMFTGQGSQHIDMGAELYATQPVFKQDMDKCAEILTKHMDIPLMKVIASDLVNDTQYTQPALFALEYSLAMLWKSWGVMPTVVLGHSVGEVVAACFAGAFSLEDGLKLIANRARLMASCDRDGSMLAIFASEKKVSPLVKPRSESVSIAAINGPNLTVISGQNKALGKIQKKLDSKKMKYTKLNVSHAFQSPMMVPILDEFAQVCSTVTFQEPAIELISNVTGKSISKLSAKYWVKHLRSAVRIWIASCWWRSVRIQSCWVWPIASSLVMMA